MRVFCHMTAGSKRRQRGLRACACVRVLVSSHRSVQLRVFVYSLVKCAKVRSSGACLCFPMLEAKKEKRLSGYLRNLNE